MKKIKQHRNHIIAIDKEGTHHVFTKDEWSYGSGFRYSEWEAGNMQEAIDFINSALDDDDE